MRKILTLSAMIILIFCTVLSLGIFVSAASSVTENDWVASPQSTLVKCRGGNCDHSECDYVYSFAVVGDTQNLVRTDAVEYHRALKNNSALTYESYTEANVKTLYNWILDNKDEKNIQYVMGLGDITESFRSSGSYYATEWGLAANAIGYLDGEIGYSLVRGNHDVSSGINGVFGNDKQYYSDIVELSKLTDAQGRPMAGLLSPERIEDSYRKIIINGDKYIIFTVDYYASDECVAWLNEILAENADYTAIITIHAFLSKDGTFLDAIETETPSESLENENWYEATYTGGTVEPRDLWARALSKHANVSMILCGHIDVDDIVVTQLMGENRNTVTCMLIDGQTIDKEIEPVGLVALLYISADGKIANVEYISTIRDNAGKAAYLKEFNQFGLELDYSDNETDGWITTEYGNIPAEIYGEMPFHVFLDDHGTNAETTFHFGSFACWEDTLEAIHAYNNIGGPSLRKTKCYYIVMSEDTEYNGGIAPSASADNPGKIFLDLNGNTLKVKENSVFLPYYATSNLTSPVFTVKNGNILMNGEAFVTLQTAEGGDGSAVELILEKLNVTWSGPSAPFVDTLDGVVGCTSTVKLTAKDCVFDVSGADSRVTVFDLNDVNNNNNVELKILGGAVKGNTKTDTEVYTLNMGDSVVFGRGDGNGYHSITLNEMVDMTEVYTTLSGLDAHYVTESVASPYVYNMVITDTSVEDTPYGVISTATYPAETYPLVLFQNGEAVAAYASWLDFYIEIGNVDTSKSKNTVLYFRSDVDHASSVSSGNNKLQTIKHITIDLGGHTLTGSTAQPISLISSGSTAFTANIFVCNGTISALNKNSPVVTINSTNGKSADACFNLTFTNVTLNRKNSGRLLVDAFSGGTYGNTTNIVFNNCTIDATGVAQLCKLEETNQNKMDVNVVINGGTITSNKDLVFASFSEERESGKGSPDSLSFGSYNGAYTTYTNKSYSAPATAFDTVEGGKAFFEATVADGTYVITPCAHSYESVCDAICDRCGYERKVPHNYTVLNKDEVYHWLECSVCGEADEFSRIAHYGGSASMTEKAICDACGAAYGEIVSHKFAFDSFSGRYICTVCGVYCEHTSWSEGVCDDCGLACMHEWSCVDKISTCVLCGKVCSSHGTRGLDFKCAYCGYDRGIDHSFAVGGSSVYDKQMTLNRYHNVNVSFDMTFGTLDTVINKNDAGRSDNIYYLADSTATTKSEYHSVFTWINNPGSGRSFLVFASLWLDTSDDTLYLVAQGNKSLKICEIKPGVKYSFEIDFEPRNGVFTIGVTDGKNKATYSGSFTPVTGQLTQSDIRFGESENAKYLRVQKCSYENINTELTAGYENGICKYCENECAHIFNAGGHCVFCGEFGNAITFADGQNGGGNITDSNGDGKPDNIGEALTVGDGVYCSQSGSYKQLWDYRDLDGMLLGRDYVFSGKFIFTDWVFDSSASGAPRLFILADGDVSYLTTKLALYLFGNRGKLELGPDEKNSSTRMTLELNREYDIRVAVRSEEVSEGVYANVADIYVNGSLKWTKEFELTAENGMAIRVGDHALRNTRAKYTVSKDFGIRCLDSNISFIGTQEKENANYGKDTEYDLRFVFGIDDLYLNDVGVKVEVEVNGGSTLDNARGELTLSSSKKVLNEIMVSGKVCKPGANGAGYGGNYLALAITDIALDTSATYTFTITPYAMHNGGKTVFSEPYTVTVSFTDHKMNITY